MFQHTEVDIGDLLDGARIMKNWDVIKLLPGEQRCATAVSSSGSVRGYLKVGAILPVGQL